MCFPTYRASLALAAALFAFTRGSSAELSVPSASGGAFRKVVLEADRDLDGDGNAEDVVVDAMEALKMEYPSPVADLSKVVIP